MYGQREWKELSMQFAQWRYRLTSIEESCSYLNQIGIFSPMGEPWTNEQLLHHFRQLERMLNHIVKEF
jgi:hypothetical protein